MQQSSPAVRSIIMVRITATIALVLIAGTAGAETWASRSVDAGPVVPASARSSAHGLNSPAAAKAAIEARGYSDVKNLQRDPVGNWAGEAKRGGLEIAVILQLDGDVAEE